jgi:hypothetical protein
MPSWRVEEGPQGLRLTQNVRRALGSEEMTWADLFQIRLRSVRVFVLYFPSRFELDVDQQTQEGLRAFGRLTGPRTSVNFWDGTDPRLEDALALFDVEKPPALVVASGTNGDGAAPIEKSDLYSIVITDVAVLSDRARLAEAVNAAEQVLMRGNPAEIAGYLRARAADRVLSAVGAIAGDLRDALLKFKPKLGLPGGVSVQIG